MPAPQISLAPTAPKPGDTVTATIIRDVPGQVIALDITTAGGTGHASVPVAEPYTLADKSSPAHTWAVVSDDGTTVKATTTA